MKTKPISAFCVFFLFPVILSAEQLLFPASSIEPEVHKYTLDPSAKIKLDLARVVDQENLVNTLLVLLKEPSRSCQETAVTAKASELLSTVAAPLNISVRTDNLPEQVAVMDEG